MITVRGLPAALAVAVVLLPGTAAAQDGGRYPGERWLRYATPEEAGFSSDGIAAARAYADSVGAAVGMLVHRGAVVTSWGDVAQPAGVHSAAKALQGTLVGIAVGRDQIDLTKRSHLSASTTARRCWRPRSAPGCATS